MMLYFEATALDDFKGTSKNCLFSRRLRWRCTQVLMYILYTAVFRAVPPRQYEKILIFRDALNAVNRKKSLMLLYKRCSIKGD